MSSASKPKVLVCDDEQQILRALRVILRDAATRRCRPAPARRRSTWPRCRVPTPAILDLVLPDIDGVELCRRLREWTDMPIIVLSAVGDEDAKVRALAAGADDYVTKPFGPRELIARLEASLRRVGPEREETLITSGRSHVDLASRVVTLAGEEVHLTPTEFDLLRAAGAQPRAADDPPRPAHRRCGARATPTTRRFCGPTSPICGARSNPPTPREAPAAIATSGPIPGSATASRGELRSSLRKGCPGATINGQRTMDDARKRAAIVDVSSADNP